MWLQTSYSAHVKEAYGQPENIRPPATVQMHKNGYWMK